jgi:hypothetical protein
MPPQNDLVDLTMDDITAALPRANNASTSDSDIEFVGIAQSPVKAKISGRPRTSSPSPPGNGKRSWDQGNQDSGRDGPSDAVLATWKRGDDDLEPSAKMLAMVELLKEWDSCGDKTICYSQCKYYHLANYSGGVYTNVCYWKIGTSMLDLIEILFSRHGIQSLRFDGKMSREVRDATLATFKKLGGPKVILIRYAIIHLISAIGHDVKVFPEVRNVGVSGMLSFASTYRPAILTSNFQPEPGFCQSNHQVR